MPLPPPDGSVGHSFGLEVDGVVLAGIREVSGLKMEQDVIELKENTPDGGSVIRKLPGRWKAGACTLTRGLGADDGFERWVRDSQSGTKGDVRKDGSILVFDAEGQQLKRYRFTRAWPTSLEITTLAAGDTSVLVEKLVLTYEKLEVG